MLIGYVCVSMDDQNLDLRKDVLASADATAILCNKLKKPRIDYV